MISQFDNIIQKRGQKVLILNSSHRNILTFLVLRKREITIPPRYQYHPIGQFSLLDL